MKKILFVAASMLLVLASCTKKENAPESPITQDGNKMPMTISATLTNGETRADYTDNEGLKATWSANETMSVVSLNSSGEALAIDNFTSVGEAGRTTANFTGTITENASTTKYICWYPAIGASGGSVTMDGALPSMYNHWSLSLQSMLSDGDLTNLAKRSVYNGIATINGSNMSVDLTPQLTVFKVVCTLPDAAVGKSVSQMTITSSRACFYPGSWSYYYQQTLCNSASSYNEIATVTLETTADITNSDKVVTFYYLANRPLEMEAADTWTVKATTTTSEEYTKTLTFNASKAWEAGKMYTLNVTLE